MFLTVDLSSATPMYAQIKEQILFAVASGKLKKMEKLPSVREVSTELSINPSTVIQAYKELEYEKVIFVKKGQGTFVAETQTEMNGNQKKELLMKDFQNIIEKASELGINLNELPKILEETIQKFDKKTLKKGEK